MPIQFSQSRKRRSLVLAGFLLGTLAIAGGFSGRDAAYPAAIVQSISEQRHTRPTESLWKAKNAFDAIKAMRPPTYWDQRVRLLYADLIIELKAPLQGSDLSTVEGLLAFEPVNQDAETRLFAAQAYLALKRVPRNLQSAKELNEKAFLQAGSVDDVCWKAEVKIHYALALVNLNDPKAGAALTDAETPSNACSDSYWAAALSLTKGARYVNLYRYEQAKAAYELTVGLAESQRFPGLIDTARNGLALAYCHLGDFDKALSLLKNAESLSEKDRAYNLSLQGFIRNMRSENNEALADYAHAVEIDKRLKLDEYYPHLEELAAVLIELNRPGEADVYNREVIQNGKRDVWEMQTALVNAATIARMQKRPDEALAKLAVLRRSVNKTTDAFVLWRLHAETAETLTALGRNKEADAQFAKAVEVAFATRAQRNSDVDRMTFSIYVERLVSRYLDFLTAQKAAPEVSLKLAETFRAQSLAEKLHLSNTPAQAMFQKIARVRQAVILSYWITPQRSYLWATNARGTKLFTLNGLEHLSRDIEDHNRQIYDEGDLLQTPKLATDLYKKLVGPGESMIASGTNVIIVPHGPLAALNFETLIPPTVPVRYWLNEVSVTVAPSLSILGGGDENTIKKQAVRLLLVGGTVPKGAPALQGSATEIEDVEKLFPAAAKVYLTGANASPQRLLDSKPGNFTLLHVSSHAFANKESPLDSFVILSPDKSHPDGYLYAHDLMNLQMHEELVTLSACEGAGGKSLPGEGQVGLTWAILSAGANKVLASSFKVSDRGTWIFMKDFYRRLAAGDKPAKALRDAKVALANQSVIPYFWAAFQLYTR